MNIQRTSQPASKPSRHTTAKAATPESESPKDSFLQSYGSEIMTGGVLGAMSAVPIVGAIPTGGMAWSELNAGPYGGPDSAFEFVAALGLGVSAGANIAGTVKLFSGNTQLGLGLLAGAGLLSGSLMALSMDGGSLASRLGLQD